jgi:CRISPR system Cascade subunit CasA
LEFYLKGGKILAVYDLLSEPWIPVETLDGTRQSLGIREVLLFAHKLRKVNAPSPLITYGIQRMLVALLMDAYRPRLIEDLADLMDAGCYSEHTVEQYFSLCQNEANCFDLFDPEKPFYQSAFDTRWDNDKKIRPVALLIHEVPGGNNHIHFDHRLEAEIALSPAACARALCAVNVFCTAGLQGPSSINGAPPLYVLHKGKTLFETLTGSMMAVREYEGIPFDDPPIAWCDHHEVEPGREVPTTSVLYGLTWQARRVLLIPDEAGGTCSQTGEECPVVVRRMYFQKGLKFTGHGIWQDPHVAYLRRKDGSLSSLKPQEGRAPWRDIASLMLKGDREGQHIEPIIVSHYRDVREGIDMIETPASLQIFGLVTNQAQYGSWMQGELGLDQRIMQSEDLSRFIEQAIRLTEDIAADLQKYMQDALGGNKQRDLVDQIIGLFYSLAREAFFEELCPAAAVANRMEEGWASKLNNLWRTKLRSFALSSYLAGAERLGGAARRLEQSARAELLFRRSLSKTLGRVD